MKRLFAITLLFTVLGYSTGCGSIKSDIKKYLELHDTFTKKAILAAADQQISDAEAEELNSLTEQISEYSEKLETQYQEEPESELEAMDIFRQMNSEKTFEEYSFALLKLYDCSGTDKLKGSL